MTAPVSSLRHGRRTAMARAVATVAVTLAAGGSPIAANAQMALFPNPNPLGNDIAVETEVWTSDPLLPPDPFSNLGRILINSPGTLRNAAQLHNRGDIDNSGTLRNEIDSLLGGIGYIMNYNAIRNLNGGVLVNHGSLQTLAGGFVINSGDLYNNNGISNSGSLINNNSLQNDGQLFNYRSLQNAGNIYNGVLGQIENAGGSDVIFDNAGSLQNFGRLANGSQAILNITSTATLANFGRLDNSNFAYFYNYGLLENRTYQNAVGLVNNSAWLENYGTLDNAQLASVNNQSGGFLFNRADAIITNRGNLVNENGAMLHNLGTIDNHGTAKNYGSFFNQGVLNIEGRLENYAGAGGTEFQLLNDMLSTMRVLGGTLVNAVGAKLNNLGSFVSGSQSTIENEGVLTNAGSWGDMTVYGNIINRSPGTLTNGPYGKLTNNGSIINDGYLNNGAVADGSIPNATLINNGSITNNFDLRNNERGLLYNNRSIINDYIFTNAGTFQNAAGAVVSGGGTYIQTGGLTHNRGTMTQLYFDIQGGTIKGSGVWEGSISTALGVTDIRPADSPGTMVINGNLTSGSNIYIEIAGTGIGQYDVLQVNGVLEFIGGLITIEFIDGFVPELDDTFNFLVAESSLGWDKLKWAVTGLGAGFEWDIVYGERGAYFDITAVPGTGSVPEPGTYALVLAGLGLIGFMSRRRKALAA